MKITCQQQTLSKAINTVCKAVTTRTTIPILKGILLETIDNSTLKLSASDLDLSIEKKISVNVLKEGSIVVSSRLFTDIIRKLPNEEIEIEVSENNVNIKCLKSEFTIVGLPPDEFPVISEIKEDNHLKISKEILKNMIKKTSFSASIDESRGIIVGVLIEIEKDNIRMVALDGFRMAVTKQHMKSQKDEKIIIPARILNEIYKILTEEEKEKEVSLVIDNKKAVIIFDDAIISSRLLEGEFINYKEIIPKTYKCRTKINRNELLDSIERASLLAREGKNNLIRMTVNEDKMIISSKSEEGKVHEEVFIEREGDGLEIGFNSKYIMDVLRVVEEEELYFEFNTNISPCLIKPVENDNFEYLILPVRLLAN